MTHKKHHDGHMSKESHMSHKGHDQGNMSPVVEDYQRSANEYSQHFIGKTTEYIERQDKHQHANARAIENKAYKGRYQ